MIFRFNKAQLSKEQRESLDKVLGVMQAENEIEIEVVAVEFPEKLKVKLDKDVEMLVVWDGEKKVYSGLTEPVLESEKDTVDLPAPESGVEVETEKSVIPPPRLIHNGRTNELAVHRLAKEFVELVKPLDVNQRMILWIDFSAIVVKELRE